MRFNIMTALGLVLAASFVGCGDGQSGDAVTPDNVGERSLSDVGELYRQYTYEHKKPPTKIADLLPMEAVVPLGLKALQSGDVIGRTGVAIQDVEEGPATHDSPDEVLAYVKEAPTSGGAVLMLNRTIRTMTADEFKAAKLAGSGDMAVKK